MTRPSEGFVAGVARVVLDNPVISFVTIALVIVLGVLVAPFDVDLPGVDRTPIPVDAIPNVGENQQIVFTEWPGRSPQDIDDQISYPLTVSLLGIPDVKSVRAYSVFGFSSVYVVFEDGVDVYWARSRILEKLASLPAGTLPDGVSPSLGPDATALGQVYWYTLEGRDEEGRPTGGWNLEELRSIQDFVVRFKLMATEGVAEVASAGGFVREYQIDVDPDALRGYDVTLGDVVRAVRGGNIDVGARTIEINNAEYVVRGVGFIESLADLEALAVTARDGVPVRLEDVATIGYGPAPRRGVLDKGGAEAVGGVVVARQGANPKAVVDAIKERIEEIGPGLPSKILPDGRESRITIVPFYDRGGLIEETIATLGDALEHQVLITVLVIVVMLLHLRSSLVVASMLPMTVLATFIAMKVTGVEANVVALAGIAIAVGTIVDVGIVLTENVVRRLQEADASEPRREVVLRAIGEVGGAVATSLATTIISFLPVLTMEGAEGKLFKPLALTKTFALFMSIVVALAVIPAASRWLARRAHTGAESPIARAVRLGVSIVAALVVLVWLSSAWEPLGPGAGATRNLLLVVLLTGFVLVVFLAFRWVYPRALAWCLEHKAATLTVPALLVLVGLMIWLGAPAFTGALPGPVRGLAPVAMLEETFPGLGREFMPALDEGSFLFMPTTMPHASVSETIDVVAKLDRAILSVPEVENAVGKIGRADSALDPAPMSMVETIVTIKPEYVTDDDGKPRRVWRDHIETMDDVWDAIVDAAQLPGTTSAPKLQPIEGRIVMLQSGFRANMGVKVFGPDLRTIEKFAVALEGILREVPVLEPATVFADRVVGKPYLEIEPDRDRLARYGIAIADFQEVVEVAIGGRPLTTTVEGRERYPVRVRYKRELRDSIEALRAILVTARDGTQVPLEEVAEIRFVRGPQMIKSEDTFLVAYVLFDRADGVAEVSAVEAARGAIDDAIAAGELAVPAGVSWDFAGSWENQVRASRRLALVVPLTLALIVLLLMLHFRSLATTLAVFAGVIVAWAGGFVLLWLYGQPGFLDVSILGANLAELFHVGPVHLSVAVWVGFLALFGIATDDGVVMMARLRQEFAERGPRTTAEIRSATIEGAKRRARACLMTSATTLLALLPVLTSEGKGSDVMIPLAIPVFGGMVCALLTLFVVPALYCAGKELRAAVSG
jgi:Cu(I)/Ag(I) efflux system membrane protein CusA/SilA